MLALASALGLSLLVIAFLLGRVSVKPEVIALSPASAEARPPSNLVSAIPSSNAMSPAAIESTFPSAETETRHPGTENVDSVGGVTPPTKSLAPLAPNAATGPVLPTLSPVALYFAQVDRLEDMGGGDPQEFASSMMPALSSGDFTAFDDLLTKARAQRQRLQSLAPPSSCVDHHRLALALSSDSVAMLERLKAALMKGDSLALVSIASDGRTLEAKAAQLKAMGEAIKKQAGP